MPLPDDEEPLGLSFFRTRVEDESFDNFSMPRTFFGRSQINSCTLRNADLSQSNLCWNDFLDVDFSLADLRGADLRCSIFKRVKFQNTDLRSADLRRAGFIDCDFKDAQLEGTRLTRFQIQRLKLALAQKRVIKKSWTAGEVPPGG